MRIPLLVLLGAALAQLPGCILLTSDDDTQCETEDDCTSRGGDFADSTCSEGICVPRATSSATTSGSTTTATTGSSSSDTSTSTGTGGSGGGPPGGCTTNLACSEELGEPAICPEGGGECVAVLNDDCPEVIGSVENDDVLIFGYVVPAKGPLSFIGQDRKRYIQMAVDEIASKGGIPAGGSGRRPIAFVMCDEQSECPGEECLAPIRAFTHLTDDLGVPAVLGPNPTNFILDLATAVGVPSGTLMLSQSTSESLEQLEDDSLVWAVDSGEEKQAAAIVAYMPMLEQRVREAQGIAKGDDIKIAVLVDPAGSYRSMAELLTANLVFNGKSALDNGSNYRPVTYEEDCIGADCFDTAINTVLAEKPNVIISIGLLEVVGATQGIETLWNEAEAPRPFYLFNSGALSDDGPMSSFIEALPDAAPRLGGLIRAIDTGTDPYRNFSLRFLSIFGEDPTPKDSTVYDSVYAMAYAAAAVASSPELTGPLMAQGMTKIVPPGPSIEVGTSQIDDAFGFLQNNTSIDLLGASGNLDFDVVSGVAPVDFTIWCSAVDEDGDAVIGVASDEGDYLYKVDTGELIPGPGCPPAR